RKTVTRRAVKGAGLNFLADFTPEYVALPENRFCSYGFPGDRLWVRETCFINDYRETAVPVDERAECEIIYRADGIPDWEGEEVLISWRPSIHMPRWASRILLEITDVRVERLQDVTEDQAKAEGVRLMRDGSDTWVGREGPGNLVTPWPTAKEAFSDLWNSINGPHAWEANPWVWCVNFKRVTP
ncbi:hypothetical protein HYE76_30490, partial [Pseudomonas tolaasii]|uniref:hypothetical protein n=1 Tax=Pseudomonas tolaasii TaxID=29442 RepID=UPI0015A03DFA